jgi:hypothetical protein
MLAGLGHTVKDLANEQSWQSALGGSAAVKVLLTVMGRLKPFARSEIDGKDQRHVGGLIIAVSGK